jgi:acyl carrier protein
MKMELKKFTEDFVGQFEDPGIKITESENFRELESWDSLTAMAILYMIESNYGVTIPVDDFKNLPTIKSIVDYVQQRSGT